MKGERVHDKVTLCVQVTFDFLSPFKYSKQAQKCGRKRDKEDRSPQRESHLTSFCQYLISVYQSKQGKTIL